MKVKYIVQVYNHLEFFVLGINVLIWLKAIEGICNEKSQVFLNYNETLVKDLDL